jgi:fermentation-respiration switch protein FrsA (DUF1100 family)
MRRRIMHWLLVLLVAYLLLCLLVYAGQSWLVYFPSRHLGLTPADLGLAYAEADIQTEDGVRLHGWAVPRQGAGAWVLHCHGNGGNISGRLDLVKLLHDLGCNVLVFDYRGYGRSQGRPSEEGLRRDAEAAWRYLTQTLGIPSGQIVLMGESLGGGVAARLAARHRPAGLILQSTFTSAVDLGAEVYPFLPVRLLCRHRYPVAEYVRSLDCPKLILHSPQDEIVPVRHGRRLFEVAAEPRQWLEIQGGHNQSYLERGPDYRQALRGFIAGAVGERADAARPEPGPTPPGQARTPTQARASAATPGPEPRDGRGPAGAAE